MARPLKAERLICETQDITAWYRSLRGGQDALTRAQIHLAARSVEQHQIVVQPVSRDDQMRLRFSHDCFTGTATAESLLLT